MGTPFRIICIYSLRILAEGQCLHLWYFRIRRNKHWGIWYWNRLLWKIRMWKILTIVYYRETLKCTSIVRINPRTICIPWTSNWHTTQIGIISIKICSRYFLAVASTRDRNSNNSLQINYRIIMLKCRNIRICSLDTADSLVICFNRKPHNNKIRFFTNQQAKKGWATSHQWRTTIIKNRGRASSPIKIMAAAAM